MAEGVEKVPAEIRWAIATKALTGAATAVMKTLRDLLGQERYNEVSGQIWAELGKASKQVADGLGLSGRDAKSAVEAFQSVLIVAMGPEFKIGTVEATAEKAVTRCTACPWWTRQQELGIPGDLCSAASGAFDNAFAKALNPKLTLALPKAMCRGDSYCETVWELQK
jgi:hypothetical protein